MTNLIVAFCNYANTPKIHFVFSNFLSENHAAYGNMSKNVVKPKRPKMTTQYGAYALYAG
jgi:hypothetical protein